MAPSRTEATGMQAVMSKPWMPLYIADYLKDTTHLRALESGAYLHLIMAYWAGEGLPSDDRQLATIAKLTDKEWKKCRPVLAAFFGPNFQSHKRIDAELAQAAEIAESNSQKARDAANKRWGKHKNGNAPSMPQASSEQCSESAQRYAPECTLHSSQRKKEDPPDGGSSRYEFENGVIRLTKADFQKWSKAYPNLNLRAELMRLTQWAGGLPPGRWFHAVSAQLANIDRDVGIQLKKQANGPPVLLTPSGNPWPEGQL